MVSVSQIAACISGGDLVLLSQARPGECEGSKFHSPTPTLVHAVPVVPTEWTPYPDEARGRTVLLCGTCQDNYLLLLQVFHHYDGQLPRGMLREMGNQMRTLVRNAWALYRGAS